MKKKTEPGNHLRGYREWVNKLNGFACVELHYTADPAKRSEEWLKQAKLGLDTKTWNTEYELSWETYGGEPVYGAQFVSDLHVLPEREEAVPGFPLLRGWDFGGNQSCVICQYRDYRLYVLDELPNRGHNSRDFVPKVLEFCSFKYGADYHAIDFIDPSGMWEGKTSTGIACADVMREYGLQPIGGIQDPSKRIDSVMRLLVQMRGGRPSLLLNPDNSMLIAGFKGGYHFPEKLIKNRRNDRPEKNEFSHVHDALQYVCTKLDTVQRSAIQEINVGDGPKFRF